MSPSRARKSARQIIKRIAVKIRTPILEVSREACGPTTASGAAILGGLEDSTRVVAPAGSPQHLGTLPTEVRRAPRPADAPVRCRHELHRHIEPVDERDVKEVQVGELV